MSPQMDHDKNENNQELHTYVLACQALNIRPLNAMVRALELQSAPSVEGSQKRKEIVTLPPGTTEVEVCAVALTLSRSTRIQGLHLPASRPGTEGMRQLGQILAENEVLHTLSFTDADFSSTCAIPSVALSESTEQKDALCVFTKEIKQNLKSSALRHLVLRHCNLTIDHVTALVDCLSYLPHFAGGSLDLSDNALGPEIALVLSKLLRAQNGPGLLNLGRNNLGDAGAAGLGGMFAADLSAESTSSSSPFASAACPEVGSVIRAQTEASTEQAFPAKDYLVEHGGSLKRNDMLPWTFHLTSLDLSYNGLGDDGLAELVRGVRVYADLNAGCPLKQLVLDGNLITDEGVMGHIHGLFPPASPGSKLKQLGLAHNKLRDDGFHAISEVVGAEGGHVALESLDLRGNQVTAEGLQSLSLMLGEPTALMELAITLPPLHPTSLGDTVAHKGNAQEQYLLQAAVFELVNTATTSQTLTSLKLEGSRRYLTEEMAHSIMRLEAHLVANQSKFKSGRAGRGKEADQGKAPGKKAKEDCAKAQPSKTQDARHVSFSVAEKPRYQDQLDAEHSALHLIQQSQISAIKSQCPPTMHRPSLSAANTSLASTPQSASFTSGTGKKSAGFHDNHVDCIGKPPIVKEKLTVGGDEEDDLPITARATGKSFLSKARPGLSTSRCDKSIINKSDIHSTSTPHRKKSDFASQIVSRPASRPASKHGNGRDQMSVTPASSHQRRTGSSSPPPGVLRPTVSAALKRKGHAGSHCTATAVCKIQHETKSANTIAASIAESQVTRSQIQARKTHTVPFLSKELLGNESRHCKAVTAERATATAVIPTRRPRPCASAICVNKPTTAQTNDHKQVQNETNARESQRLSTLSVHAASLEAELRDTRERLEEEERMHNEIIRLIVEILS